MVTRDFDAMLSEKAGVRPTFRVGGQEFTCKAKVPFKRFAKLLEALTEDGDGEGDKADKIFRLALVAADRERFLELLNADGEDDEDRVIAPEQVREMTDWLLEHYSGKASPNSDTSSNGASTTGPPPNVVSLTSRSQAG